ncbi:MAG: LysR family transcriptional regulator [Rhodoblastus sp.]|nr:MAG: LysR family transcriptional regulator [Rhodoblastus sp.]
MSDFDFVELRSLDFALLLLFRETLRVGKLTRAAERLGLTPSAASHGLGRLRRAFDDELFLRRPHGMEPTDRARRLAPMIESILAQTQEALSGERAFDVARLRRDVTLVASDMTLAILAAPLLACVRRDAPGLRVAFRAPLQGGAARELREGAVDMQVGPALRGDDLLVRPLYAETFRVLARRRRRSLSLKNYLAADHLLVAMDGSFHGVVDEALRRRGLARRVVASVPNFLAALAMIAESDMLLTAPARLAQAHARAFGLSTCEPPLDVGAYDVSITRARRRRADPALDWLCDQIVAILADTPTPSRRA